MTLKIPEYVEQNIIRNWLLGKSRDEIATEDDTSTGSVSNIIKKFIDRLGQCDAETIRELAIQIKKVNLTPKDCAIGFRVNKILENIGIANEEMNIESFLKEIDHFATKINRNPSFIRDCLYELIKISHEISFPSQMTNYIQQKREEKELLESQVEGLKEEIRGLKKEMSDAETRFIARKNEIGVTTAGLDWYVNIRDSLENEGIPVEDISLLYRLVSIIKKYRNNIPIFPILQRIDNLDNLEKDIDGKNRTRNLLKRDIEVLKEHDSKLLDSMNSKILKLNCLDEVEMMGFNFGDLKKLNWALKEMAYENNINPQEVKEQFFDSLSQYAYKITLQNELEKLNKSVFEVQKLIHNKKSNLPFQGITLKMLQNLMDKGMDENDIFQLKKFVEMVDGHGLKTKESNCIYQMG